MTKKAKKQHHPAPGAKPPEVPELLAGFGIDERDHAHEQLEEIRAEFPFAECRDTADKVEIWSGPEHGGKS